MYFKNEAKEEDKQIQYIMFIQQNIQYVIQQQYSMLMNVCSSARNKTNRLHFSFIAGWTTQELL